MMTYIFYSLEEASDFYWNTIIKDNLACEIVYPSFDEVIRIKYMYDDSGFKFRVINSIKMPAKDIKRYLDNKNFW